MIAFRPVTPATQGYPELLRESLTDGHAMLQRLQDNWRNGTNLFSNPGEILIGAFDGSRLLGLCGRNIDPYEGNPRTGRVRHLYVARSGRFQGVGRLLVKTLAEGAEPFFDHLNARAPEAAFGFYEHLGFECVEDEPTVTHRLHLKPSPRHRTAPNPIR
jgi:GNAT superfamily N-acetyltransferase